jgi:hypothetical protein
MANLESMVQQKLQAATSDQLNYAWVTETVIREAPTMDSIHLGAVLFRIIKHSTNLPDITRQDALQRIHQIINCYAHHQTPGQ